MVELRKAATDSVIIATNETLSSSVQIEDNAAMLHKETLCAILRYILHAVLNTDFHEGIDIEGSLIRISLRLGAIRALLLFVL